MKISTQVFRKDKKSISSYILLILSLIFISANILAQVPQHNNVIGTGTNAFPFSSTAGLKSQNLYLPGDFAPVVSPGNNITRLYWRAATANATSVFTNFNILLGQTTAVQFPGAGNNEFFTGLTNVLSSPSFSLTSGALNDWFFIDLQTPFLYDPSQTLIIEVVWASRTGTGISVRTSTGPAVPFHKRITAGTTNATIGNTSAIWTDFGIDVIPAGPCTNPPTAGTVTSSANPVCPGINFSLTLNGNTAGTGQTYQWQNAPSSSGPWTNLGTLSSQITSQTTDTWYRCEVTCGVMATTAPLLVTTNPVTACYCPAAHTNTCAGHISNVIFNTLNNTSICNIPTISYPASGLTTTTVTKNSNYNLSVTISATSTLSISAWFDWNA